MKVRIQTLGLCAGLAFQPASADTLTFRGVAATTCALTNPVDGIISLQADLLTWLTTQAATINATNTAPATVTVTRPSNWSSSPAGTPATSFSHVVTLTGTNAGTLTGTGTAMSGALTALGTTTVAVALTAYAGTAYKAGAHEAQVTVTCTVP